MRRFYPISHTAMMLGVAARSIIAPVTVKTVRPAAGDRALMVPPTYGRNEGVNDG